MESHEQKYPKGKEALDDFTEASKMRKSKNMPKKSPYTVTIWMQITACIVRAYQRMWGDKSTLVSTFMSNLIMSLVIGSVFYNTPQNTSGFFSKVVISGGDADRRLVLCFLESCSMLSKLLVRSVRCTSNGRLSYCPYKPELMKAKTQIAGAVSSRCRCFGDVPCRYTCQTFISYNI
jgi:hypothetical protein